MMWIRVLRTRSVTSGSVPKFLQRYSMRFRRSSRPTTSFPCMLPMYLNSGSPGYTRPQQRENYNHYIKAWRHLTTLSIALSALSAGLEGIYLKFTLLLPQHQNGQTLFQGSPLVLLSPELHDQCRCPQQRSLTHTSATHCTWSF